MKKLQFILFSLFVIGCTDDAIQQQLSQLTNLVDSVPEQALTILDSMREESADAPASYRMRIELAYANARNKINIPFTSTEEMQALSNYFDAHGSANEKLLAHYLLGLSFFDTHDAPRAIHSFIDAIEQADTSDADCNFRQLSIVWAQIANVYYYQGLYEEQLSAIDSSVKYALIAGDTLRAVTHLEQKANAYFALNNADSVIWICEQVADEYEKAGRKDLKAMALGFCVDKVIEKGNYVKARQYLSYYDAYSGLVDSCGNIEKGREIYYYFKGRYYAAVGMADSAEYFFRKEMREGPDPNNQNAASHGLANLFQQQHKPDSAARYALYSYTMNDSTYRQSTAAEVKRVQALYNYSHYQSIASKKQAEVHSLSQKISIAIIVIILLLVVVGVYYARTKIKEVEQAFKIRRCQSAIALLQNDNISLQAQGKNLQEIVGEKEIYIEKFKKELSQVRQNATKRLKTTEDEIKKTYEYRYLSKIMVKGSIFSDEDWQVVNKILLEYLPGFYEFLATKSHLMNTTEYRTCMLVRLYFKPLDVANSLGISPSYVSKIRTNLLSSLFGIEGTGKQFDTELREID